MSYSDVITLWHWVIISHDLLFGGRESIGLIITVWNSVRTGIYAPVRTGRTAHPFLSKMLPGSLSRG